MSAQPQTGELQVPQVHLATHRAVRVTYVSEATAVALRPTPASAMVSITEPGRQAELLEGWGALLRVHFRDAEYDHKMIQEVRAAGKRFDPTRMGFPDRRSAEQIRAFLTDVAQRPGISELVVHCHAGQRRSAAVARYAADLFGADFDRTYDGYNRTVYSLLTNPGCFDEGPARGAQRGRRNALYAVAVAVAALTAAALVWLG